MSLSQQTLIMTITGICEYIVIDYPLSYSRIMTWLQYLTSLIVRNSKIYFNNCKWNAINLH